MVICSDCKKEMYCAKTGVGVRYTVTGEHVYNGDKFTCMICRKSVIVCNSTPCRNSKFQKEDLFMDTTKEEAEKIIKEKNDGK